MESKKATAQELPVYKDLRRFRGAINALAEKSGLTRQYVTMVLKGLYKNQVLVSLAESVLLDFEQQQQRQLEERLKHREQIAELQNRNRDLLNELNAQR